MADVNMLNNAGPNRRMYPNPARVDRDDEKRMLPCRYFLSGFCQKGPRCKFYHPNMHIRDSFVKVPDLPPGFWNIPQPGRPRGGSSFAGSMPRPRSSFRNSNSATSLSPPRGSRSNFTSSMSLMSPSTRSYSQYQQSSSRRLSLREELFDGDEDFDEELSGSPDSKPAAQNTIFNHIDWSEFLIPGVSPPLPTPVPDPDQFTAPTPY